VKTHFFPCQVVTERESWILSNKDSGINDIEANARAVEPGYDMMTDMQRSTVREEVEGVLNSIYSTHGQGKWKSKLFVNDTIADITLQQVRTKCVFFFFGGGGAPRNF
jgi:isocitrate dehydrogenase